MTRSLRALSALAVLALAAPAAAQPTTRDHRKPKPAQPAPRPSEDIAIKLEVTSWGPKVAKPGQVITLEGRAFGKATVLVGGRPVVARLAGGKLTFRVPPVWGDGEIRLRKPNVADDYVVGTLVVDADPLIAAFAPARGPAGTRVELKGKAFKAGDELRLSGVALALAEQSEDRLVFVVPDGAKTDYLALYRAGAQRARSRRPFVVEAPAPVIAGLQPEYGAPGSTVRITGSHFGPTDRARYGNQPTAVVARGNGWLDVKVPPRALSNDYFYVRGEGGETRSPRQFRLELPPVIADLRPTFGAAGSPFSLVGKAFQAGDQVFVGGKKAEIRQLRETQIDALVPYGTPGGDVVVRRGALEVKARKAFEVVNAPTLTGFTPSKGEPGTKVTLTGTWLKDAQVWYGASRITPSAIDHNSIVLTIPAGASSQPFRVKTRGGEATSAKAFEVLLYGVISDAKPRRVAPGAQLTLYGANLDQIEKLMLNDLVLPLSHRPDRTATVAIPANARDGKLMWISHGRRAETTWAISILYPPSIAGFQPEAGPPGTRVIVRGKDFDAGTRLYFGDLPMAITKRSATELVGTIPPRATGKQHLWVQGDGAKVRSGSQFTVEVAPTITAMTPWSGLPGASVTVRGNAFDDRTEILIGSWRATVVKRGGPGVLYVKVPEAARPGEYDVVARAGTLSTTAARKFTVEAPLASITGFASAAVDQGATLEILGAAFHDGCKFYFTGKELAVTRRDPSGSKIWVTIPEIGRAHV